MNYNLREASTRLMLPSFNLQHMHKSWSYLTTKLWNGLPTSRGVPRIFQRGGHTVSKVEKKKGLFSYGQDIVMAFSPSVVGSLVKKGLQKGGVTGTPGPPLPTPLPTRIRECPDLAAFRRALLSFMARL